MVVPGQGYPFKRPASGCNPEKTPVVLAPATPVVALAGAVDDFSVHRVAMAVAHSQRESGMAVVCDVAEGVRGRGRAIDLGVVLRILLRATAVSSGGQPVSVRGGRYGGAVVLLMEPAESAHNALVAADWNLVPGARREWTPTVESEVTLALDVAVRLMAVQGGDVWATTFSDGRVAFAVRLPVAPVDEEAV
jgi:hypothetical protein